MKYIISKKQYNFLVEQSSYEKGIWDRSTKMLDKMSKLDPHTVATILQIGTAFIPVAGPFISASIGLADAALYYKEGDNNSAGLTAAFSMLPFVGSVVSKIPGVKQLGSKGMAALSNKISGGANLTKAEIELANAIKRYTPQIKDELSKMAPKIKNIVKDIETYKPNFVKKFGEKEYNDLLVDYLYDGIDKKTFISKIKNVKNPNIQLKPVFNGGADHRVFESVVNPNVVFKAEVRPGEIDKWFGLFNKYPNIFPKTFKKTRVKDVDGKMLSAVVLEKLEIRSFMKLWDDVEKILFRSQKDLPYSRQITNLEYLVKHIKEPSYKKIWDSVVIESKKNYPNLKSKIDEFYNMVNKMYQISPNPDIRKFNLGYSKDGVLKVLDI